MEKRENVLREVLEENEKEAKNWQTFIEENETAINNMNMFSKKLTVDVMVPFGKKAFFPGRIIHTNEILVAHYQDYFSECSTYVATEICKMRIENGKKRLAEIQAEKDLFKNKLEKPHLDGVLPNIEEQEIIEEYDEESERIWRQQHRQRVKDAKLNEKKEREELMSKSMENDDLQSLQEEDERSISDLNDELIELENEYEKETNDLLNKLISGEMKLPPPKKRIAHSNTKKPNDTVKLESVKFENAYQLENTLKISSLISENKIDLIDDGNESDSSTSEIPEEIRLIEEQAGFLPENDRIGFYQYQLQIIDQKLTKRTFSNNKELEEKLHLFKVRDYLEELLEEALPVEPDFEPNVIEKEGDVEENLTNRPKRRISFATEDKMLEFRKNETVAQMLPNTPSKQNTPIRDIIRLDEPILNEESNKEIAEQKLKDPVEKRKTILEKVEENLKNNNMEDADLVNKIIGSTANHIQTLHIHFKHSSVVGPSLESMTTEIPRTPADLSSLFRKNVNNDLFTNADNNFYLKESDRERAYVDVRSEFLAPNNKLCEDIHSKSILKNKCAVEREKHIIEEDEKPKNIQKKQKKPANEEDYLSAYNKVMGDVIENATEPDPLPEEKFINMHAPKKRISRFKQMRKENN